MVRSHGVPVFKVKIDRVEVLLPSQPIRVLLI